MSVILDAVFAVCMLEHDFASYSDDDLFTAPMTFDALFVLTVILIWCIHIHPFIFLT
jgi:hypothetical protein